MADKLRVGYASGSFDLFHVGHLNLLRNAKAACDFLIAGVVTDEVAERSKGGRPAVPLEERLEIVESIVYVDRVVIDDCEPDEKLAMWHRYPFDIFIKGDDWKGSAKGRTVERDFAQVGVTVHYVPYTKHTSSTLLRQTLARAVGGGM